MAFDLTVHNLCDRIHHPLKQTQHKHTMCGNVLSHGLVGKASYFSEQQISILRSCGFWREMYFSYDAIVYARYFCDPKFYIDEFGGIAPQKSANALSIFAATYNTNCIKRGGGIFSMALPFVISREDAGILIS